MSSSYVDAFQTHRFTGHCISHNASTVSSGLIRCVDMCVQWGGCRFSAKRLGSRAAAGLCRDWSPAGPVFPSAAWTCPSCLRKSAGQKQEKHIKTQGNGWMCKSTHAGCGFFQEHESYITQCCTILFLQHRFGSIAFVKSAIPVNSNYIVTSQYWICWCMSLLKMLLYCSALGPVHFFQKYFFQSVFPIGI